MIIAALSDVPAQRNGPVRTMLLREVTANEELGAFDARSLLAALCAGGAVTHDALNLSEQDMAIAALYRALYGETVECHIPCAACDRKFETQFELADWFAALRDGPAVQRLGANAFRAGDLTFRIPTAMDLDSVADVPFDQRPAQLKALCLLEGDPDAPGLQAAMASAGPMLDDDIETQCPHCGHAQSFHLRLEDYFLSALRRERPVILREIHHIAMNYKWSRTEIMALPRSVRREYVRLILSEHRPRGVASWQ